MSNPPVLVGAITVTNLTNNSYTLTWPAATDDIAVTGYEISLDGGVTWPLTTTPPTVTINVSGRTPSSTDQVRVRAVDVEVQYSSPVLSIPVTLFGTVTAITMTGPTSGVVGIATSVFTLGVTAVNGYIASPIVVMLSDGGGGGTFSSPTVTLSSVSPSQTFIYTPGSAGSKTISVTNGSGLGNPANIVLASTADTTPPVLTGTITVTNVSYTGYTLAWPPATDNAMLAGYNYSLDGGATYTQIGAVTTVTVTGRSSGVTDQIRVRARDLAGNLSSPVLSTSVAVPTTVLRNLNTVIAGRKILDTYRTGVLGSVVPSSGTYPSMLYSYVGTNSLLASEVSAYVESTTLPDSTWFAYSDGSLYVAPFATPGGYTLTVRYRIFGVDQGTNTVTVVVGTVASAVVMTGPSGGGVGLASSNFTLVTNGNLSTPIVVTPSDAGNGGTFTPATINLSLGSPSGTFTYTPATLGSKTISVTNDGGLSNPANITYLSADATRPILTGVVTPSNVSFTTATISWPTASDNVAVTGYDYSLDNINWTPLGLVNTYNLTGLTQGTLYTCYVRARDAAGNFSSPVISGSFTSLILYSLTTSALKNISGTLLTNVPVSVFVNSAVNGDLVVLKTGLTSHASTAVVSFTDALLAASTQYHLVIKRTDTGAEGFEVRTSV